MKLNFDVSNYDVKKLRGTDPSLLKQSLEAEVCSS